MARSASTSDFAPQQRADAGGVDVFRLLHQLYRHKWLILGIVAAAIVGTHYWTSRLQRLYQADCSIEYDPNPMRPLGRDMDDSPGAYYFWSSQEFFATQNRILTSRALAERVVRKLSLHHNADFMGISGPQAKSWRGGDIIQAARRLQGQIQVEQERDTRVVHVRVTDNKPERATLLANAVVDAYMEKVMEDRLGSTSNALDWLSGQLDSLKNQLESSELSLHEFVEGKASLTMPFEEQQKLVSADIGRFSTRLGEARIGRIEQAARLKALEAADNPDPMHVVHPTIIGSPSVADLHAKYLEASRQRKALEIKYGDNHPQIQALDVQLDILSTKLRLEIDGVIESARSGLREVEAIEAGIQGALQVANKAGLELNLQEITYRRLQRERDNSSRLYGSILERTAETDLSHALQVSFVRVVDRALKPGFSIYPSYRKNLTVGTLIGLLLGIGLSLLFTQLDRVIRTIDDAEMLGFSVLGVIPKIDVAGASLGPRYGRRKRRNAPELVTNRDLIVHTHPKSSVAECCRTIRTNLTFMSADRPQRALVLTSASPREGKTTVALSLAISLAQSGKRVLLVDTDLRKPRVHKALARSSAKGVTTVLVGAHTAKEAIQSTDVPGVDLLASGPIPPNPAELLHTAQFRDLVAELRTRYDIVLFDSPPLNAVTDAAVIAPQVDGVVMIIHGQKTTRDAARSAMRQLRDVSANITGGVLNDVDLSSRQYGYGSYYYYHHDGYYSAEAEEHAPAAEA
ncbi:MAG TPA: polysaccharide biosynthesis tyrosine autokinase [Polyangiales bacterium]|nr:polysaccharide biosynthesis tyrosine autokinase [Polyangiales bacterium]